MVKILNTGMHREHKNEYVIVYGLFIETNNVDTVDVCDVYVIVTCTVIK